VFITVCQKLNCTGPKILTEVCRDAKLFGTQNVDCQKKDSGNAI
jgi:hypothetical protein